MILGKATGLYTTKDPKLHSWTLANPNFFHSRGGGGGLFHPVPGASDPNLFFLQSDIGPTGDGASYFAVPTPGKKCHKWTHNQG